MKYPAKFEPDHDAGGFIVTFRDIPEAVTQGESETEAAAMAADALLTAMDFYFDDKREVPAPSAARKGEHLISLPASVAAKVLLLNEMLRQNVGPTELARRLDTTKQEVNRIVTLSHATKIDRIEDALGALGKSLTLQLV